MELLVATPTASDEDISASSEIRRRRRAKNSVLKVDGDGVLQLPIYRKMRREQSRLLSYAWAQDWDEVMKRCHTHPEEATHMTQHSGRTALHLATFNHPCPLNVAQALLKANRHMVLVQDSNWYTPLHNVAFFPGESLVKIVCHTAIMVQQELSTTKAAIPPTSGTSPLFLAAKRAAPLRTLRQLLETRQHTEWIAPSTGGEPYWMDTLDEYSSPLEILIRDRAITTWGLKKHCATPIVSHNQDMEPFSTPQLLRPRLLWQMKQIATKRLRDLRGTKNDDSTLDDEFTSPVLDDQDDSTTEEEMQAISLWTKCVELLSEHVPRLLVNQDDDNLQTLDSISGQMYSNSQFAVVHCVASAKVPLPNLLQVSLMVFPEQALMRDEYGMLPLHHVLCAKHLYATNTLVSMLLNHSPQAALYSCPFPPPSLASLGDYSGMSTTPLALALTMDLPLDILRNLLWADSDCALTTIDPLTGLYPFATAATKCYDLDVVYTLLNAHPQVLNQLLKQDTE